MFDQVKDALIRYCGLDKNRHVIVGVSGGPDSLSLLDILHRLDYPIIVCHIHHGLRSEAGDEAAFVQRLAQKLNLHFILEHSDVRVYAQENQKSIEEAAREVRYHHLFSQAIVHKAQAVAVGHTADDQVETVLMHLLRGSGLSGLRGMRYKTQPTSWSVDIPLVRPLLGIWRDEVAAYCDQNDLNPIHDLSNLDQTIHRNRIRHELIPQLESYNPRIKQTLIRTAQILASEDQLIEQALDKTWSESFVEESEGYVALDRFLLLEMALGLQRRVLRRAIRILRPDLKDINFAAIERALDCVRSDEQSAGCDLVAGLRLAVEGGSVWIAERAVDLPKYDWPQISPDQQYQFEFPGGLELSAGWRMSAEIDSSYVPGDLDLKENADSNRAWFDADQINVPLLVRTRKPGDRFNPLGMDGHTIKVSEFMINAKLPRRARSHWPLVISGDDIIWIPGIRQSHTCRVTESTKRLLHITITQVKNGE